MQDSIQTTQAPATQQSSIPSSAPVPNAGYQATQVRERPTFVPDSFGSLGTRLQAPQAAPQVQEANPWQEAFQSLSASLNGTQVSQPQAAYSTPTPRNPTQPANFSSSSSLQAAPSVSGMQTYQPQATARRHSRHHRYRRSPRYSKKQRQAEKSI